MHRSLVIAASILGAAACSESSAPEAPPAYEFGSITATIDGRPWASTPGPDSVVAGNLLNDSTTLEVIGWKTLPTGFLPYLYFRLPPAGLIAPSAAALGNPLSLSTTAYAAWQPVESSYFASTGLPGDSIWIESYDAGARTIRGHFTFTGTEVNPPRDTVRVVGTFEGYVRLIGSVARR